MNYLNKFSQLYNSASCSAAQLVNVLLFLTKTNQCEILVKHSRDLFANVIYELRSGRWNNVSILMKWLKLEVSSPPLELMWILEKENLLHVTTFLYFHTEYSSTIVNSMYVAVSGDLDSADKLNVKLVLTHVMGIILAVSNTTYFKHLAEEIITGTISEVLKHLDSTNTIDWNYFSDLVQQKNISPDIIKDFAKLHLMKCFTLEGRSYEICDVIKNHSKLWTSQKIPEEFKCFIQTIISTLEAQIVLSEINTIVLQETFNWKFLLYTISIFSQNNANSELLKSRVDNWFKNAIDEKNKNLLYIVLIIARHCCAEKARYFTNYPTWFGSISLKTTSTFSFFFECLSKIVPYEAPLFLKIHVNKVPSAPSNCQSIIVDYIDLAKTQLSDLNETIDYIGLFNDYHETDEEGQESDIHRAVSFFNEKKEIPKPLLEASVFRRQYYEKTFLKRLLSVSEKDDPSRVPLIKKLYSVGKIPSAMYRSWSSLSLPSN